MNLIRIFLAVGWLVIAWASWRAGTNMGMDVAGGIFFGDMAHPWRGQFNIDFLLHLLALALWLGWTARSKKLAPVVALATVTGGALFSFAYLLVRSFGGDQSVRHLLLGRHQGGADAPR